MTAAQAAAGLVVDQIFGEPPVRVHPVVWFGSLMKRVERRCYADSRFRGALFTAFGVGVGVSAGVVVRAIFGKRFGTVLATAVCSAGKMLDTEAMVVASMVESGDLDGAKLRLGSLVGRTTAELNESEISRAVVESVAENCVDAVTSSLFWAAVAGAPGVFAHRAINTLDAMVGHHSERYENFGWASARLDDVANFVPARLNAIGVIVSHPRSAITICKIVRRDAPQHPSPNGGIIEAAFAAALGIKLGGTNTYGGVSQDRGTLGDGPPPNNDAIIRAVALRRSSSALTALLILVASLLVQQVRVKPLK